MSITEDSGSSIEDLFDPPEGPKRFREIGTSGLKRSAGVVLEEFLPQLEGQKGRDTYREMADNDPVLGGIIYTFEMLFRNAKRTVRPAELRVPTNTAQNSTDNVEMATNGDLERPEHAVGDPTSVEKADEASGSDTHPAPSSAGVGDLVEDFTENEFGDPVMGTTQVPSKSEEAAAVAAFVDECFDDMSMSFSDLMSQIASMFIYGWDVQEIVYKRREGENSRSPGKSSKFDDNMIGWRKFSQRAQNSIWDWEFDERGGITAFWQQDTYAFGDPRTFGTNQFAQTIPGLGQPLRIPIQKMLLFKTTDRHNSPEGRSILRSAYRPWYFKKRIEEIEAIGIERDLAGMPVIHAPGELFSPNASADQVALLAEFTRAIKNVRRDAQDGLIFPLEYDENGNKVYEFELMSTGGQRQLNTNDIIERKNMEMAMSVLADFMMIGSEEAGSLALSQDKTNLFATAVDGFLAAVADVFNRHAIPRLLSLNGIPGELAPIVTFEAVRAPTLTELGEYIQRLARAGAPFFPDERLQAFFHERAGMPPPSPQAQGGQNDGSLLPEGDGSFGADDMEEGEEGEEDDNPLAEGLPKAEEDEDLKTAKPRGPSSGHFDD